ncbi:MAG: PD40 domain-containing protein [Candidatus Latescibacteria bacterium]|nr:PD40 domain-containing protein [Candidatus Latescibacterota bacterium]
MLSRFFIAISLSSLIFTLIISCDKNESTQKEIPQSGKVSSSKIVFESTRGGGYDIFTMNDDGSEITKITDSRGMNKFPAWSPDGTRIVFMSNRIKDSAYDIFTVNADGTNLVRLTEFRGWNGHPDWSPDGKRIIFDSAYQGDFEIYSMNTDGTDVINLTQHDGWDNRPQWSPDGTRIAFVTKRDDNFEIYVMNADGSNQINLTNHADRDDMPQWSPDGTKIAFVSNRDREPEKQNDYVTEFRRQYEKNNKVIKVDDRKVDVFVMNADGSNQVNLTNYPENDTKPTWSPDGSRIAFITFRNGMRDIYTMAPDGSDLRPLTNDKDMDEAPDWSGVIKK